jgi:hypothetical protein
MPVDQTGEDILFIADGETVEVHIRIQYEGEAENFAWVIPVLSVPTDFRVGSEAFFDNIKAATVPTYGITNQFDSCDMGGSSSATAGGPFGSTSGTTGDAGTSGGTDTGGGPTIYAQETVGAFEITVLGDGTIEEVMTWLGDNGYQQDPAAEPILGEYLDEGHYFAAIKLVGDAGVEELHPIALKFDHSEPCVPLRLTRIAATDDMDVRAYFLGDNRVVPKTYRHVLVNPLKIDWPNQAANYKEVITRAVDADEANGRAFVTEYAGPSEVVNRFGLDNPGWNANAFVGLAAVDAPGVLLNQGLVNCGWDPNTGEETCLGTHPMVDPILAEFLPIPEGVAPFDFYNDTELYAGLIDESLWDADLFAARLDERVIEPGRHASELLDQYPYLTRMYTTISPHEMMEDPMFHENPDLAEVVAARTATNRLLCSGDSVWTLPDGREVFVPLGATWPDIGGDKWWEEEVQETPAVGAEMVLVNNTDAINAALDEYNAMHGWDGAPEIPGGTDGGADTEGGGSAGADGDSSAEGCGCNADTPARGAGWATAFLLVGLFARRRN